MKKVLQGNIALCEGAIEGGLDAYYAYPITPQNEISAYFAEVLPKLNKVFLQAESEIAAINMVFGTAVTGKRAMTSSSSPGISLMQEGISYLCGCELPCLIVNVMRGGPGLGNISGSQQDYFQSTRGGGHGDYHTIVLAPFSVKEIYEFAKSSFILAEKYRIPVLIIYDGYLGQMMEIFDTESNEGKLDITVDQPIDKNWILDGAKDRHSRKIRSLLMNEGELEKHNWNLKEKYEKIKKNEVRAKFYETDDAEICLVAYGIAARAALEAIYKLREKNIKAGLIRPQTLWPFPYNEIANLAKKVKKFLVVEMNLGQMVEDVKLAVNGIADVYFYGRPGGSLVSSKEIIDYIVSII
ncbi:MAG: 3-methyl-2-oxobutanoate dehydrogenase subunit VorB [Endomicrobia bacterium]|nr:3-methyl-2-oxobutanoate dehydrogenase subunit VorB [Endomicrobiia bacterium]MDW8055870.1 3-methyl-2-oxobutanoate dehydrogenase subunit VorB [Elusimicrobiota bacterium]